MKRPGRPGLERKGAQRRRCAIYTRVSTDLGLDQDFNSLDAQREAAEAYIKSQAHEGWSLIKTHYDDGGFSGGSVDRPALRQLLADVRAGSIDVVVVYKVDRLTRSLADFAKLVELFDEHEVSFISVTQAFNTTSSMGRLTLNVLLSFAQFEREVTSERIRDKIAASKRRGLWVGGMVPLGYESRDKKLMLVDQEAERVRLIFRRYLELGSLDKLLQDLRQRQVVTKVRHLSNGRTIGGIAFTRGPLAHLLRNRFYIGEVLYRGEICPAEHPPIVDRPLFEAVQAKLASQHRAFINTRAGSPALLMGKLFDDRGNRMTPTHARKAGVRYRYYVSCVLAQGRHDEAGSVARVAAAAIEPLVVSAVREACPAKADLDDNSLVSQGIDRVVVRPTKLEITLLPELVAAEADAGYEGELDDTTAPRPQALISIDWTRATTKPRREIIRPAQDEWNDNRPIRAETRGSLVRAIALGRRWLDDIVTRKVADPDEIAEREACSKRRVTMTISLAFLAPDLVKAAIEGRLPRGIGLTRLADPPIEWARQWEMLGLKNGAPALD